MTMTFFDQFAIPYLLNFPLIVPAMFIPLLLFPISTRFVQNRLYTLTNNFAKIFMKQLLLPLSKNAHTYASLLLSLMLMLMTLNLLGMLPYTFTPTTQLSMNMALAIPLWLMTVLIGLRTQPTSTLGHMLPEGTPTPLIPMLILIETTSLFIRPLALGVRLTANLTAGHLLMQLISTAVLVLTPISPSTSLLLATVLILLTLLEIAVALIQAYVFVLLLTLYLQENT